MMSAMLFKKLHVSIQFGFELVNFLLLSYDLKANAIKLHLNPATTQACKTKESNPAKTLQVAKNLNYFASDE